MRRIAALVLFFLVAMILTFFFATLASASESTSHSSHREICCCEMDQYAEEANEAEGNRILAIVRGADTHILMVNGKDALHLYEDVKTHFYNINEACENGEEPRLLIEESQISAGVWYDFFKFLEEDSTIFFERVFWPDSTGERSGYLLTLTR